jgi:hypothetical protein
VIKPNSEWYTRKRVLRAPYQHMFCDSGPIRHAFHNELMND